MPDHDAHDIIVLFSSRSRDAYAAEAKTRGETYTFTDAWGLPRTWVKGEYAYLAPNAAGLLLARCNLKHHWSRKPRWTRRGFHAAAHCSSPTPAISPLRPSPASKLGWRTATAA